MIQFQTLGTLDLRADDGASLHSILSQTKRVALLLYLAVARPPGPHTRDRLIALFWRESDEERARRALSQALYVLRRGLGEDVLVTRGDDVVVDAGAIACDARQFREALEADDFADALELYGGELAPGFHLDDAPEFMHWLDSERGRLREDASRAARTLAAAERDRGNPAGAAGWSRRALELSPFDEAVVRELLEDLLGAGDRPGALRAYREYSTRLSEELEIEPGPETAALFEGVREAVRQGPAEGSTADPVLTSGPRTSPSPEPARPEPAKPTSRARAARRLALAGLPFLLLVGTALVAARRSAPASPVDSPPGPAAVALPEPSPRVLVADLLDETGDPVLESAGRVAADRVVEELTRTGLASVVRAGGVAVSGEDGGDGLVVSGSVRRSQEGVLFKARIVHEGTAEVVGSIEASAPVEDPLRAVEALGQRTAASVVMLLDPRTAGWASAATRPSEMHVFNTFVSGLDLFTRSWSTLNANEARAMRAEAVAAFRLAAASDPEFTAPLIWAVESHLREEGSPAHPEARARADSIVRLLEPRRAGMPAWDRAMLDFQRATLDFDRVAIYEAMRRVVDVAPGSEWVYRLADAALGVNRPGEAKTLLLGMPPARGDGDPSGYWETLAEAYHMLGEFEDELEVVEAWRAEGGESGRFYLAEVRALASAGRADQAIQRAKEIIESTGQPGTPELRFLLPQVLRAHVGQTAARELAEFALPTWSSVTTAAARSAQSWATEESPIAYYYGLNLYAAGRLPEAERHFRALAAEKPDVGNYLGMLGVLAAARGDEGRARRISDELAARAGRAQVRFEKAWLTLYRARIAGLLGRPGEAVQLLREALLNGLEYGAWLHIRLEPWVLEGYRPYAQLLDPKG